MLEKSKEVKELYLELKKQYIMILEHIRDLNQVVTNITKFSKSCENHEQSLEMIRQAYTIQRDSLLNEVEKITHRTNSFEFISLSNIIISTSDEPVEVSIESITTDVQKVKIAIVPAYNALCKAHILLNKIDAVMAGKSTEETSKLHRTLNSIDKHRSQNLHQSSTAHVTDDNSYSNIKLPDLNTPTYKNSSTQYLA